MTHGTNVRSTLFTTSTLTRKSTTVVVAPLSIAKASTVEPFAAIVVAAASFRERAFCDVVRRSAKREEKIDQRWSPSFSRMKSAAKGSSLDIAFSDFCRCNVRVSARRNRRGNGRVRQLGRRLYARESLRQ